MASAAEGHALIFVAAPATATVPFKNSRLPKEPFLFIFYQPSSEIREENTSHFILQCPNNTKTYRSGIEHLLTVLPLTDIERFSTFIGW
jgi:hypothetical protein